LTNTRNTHQLVLLALITSQIGGRSGKSL
jgi:hypothetical protein